MSEARPGGSSSWSAKHRGEVAPDRLRRDRQMRVMFIIKSAAAMGPTPELLEAMHTLATREIAAGRMIDDGGLEPLDMGARITNARGTVAVLDGPFAESKEVIGG